MNALVRSVSLNGWDQFSSVNSFHDRFRRPAGLLNVKITMLINGANSHRNTSAAKAVSRRRPQRRRTFMGPALRARSRSAVSTMTGGAAPPDIVIRPVLPCRGTGSR